MQIGLGAIAKGYAIDRAAEVLKAHQIKDYIVDGGGNLRIAGRKGREPWNVGIRNPRAKSGSFARFNVEHDLSVSTSGDYVKYFVLDGKRYHHILDPNTGYPARGVVSATVIAKSAELADAMSTAVFVLGVKRGLELVESDPELDAIIVDESLQVHVTSRFASRVTLMPITDDETGEVTK
jgi:thiamine biosynthesis lipoprotein